MCVCVFCASLTVFCASFFVSLYAFVAAFFCWFAATWARPLTLARPLAPTDVSTCVGSSEASM